MYHTIIQFEANQICTVAPRRLSPPRHRHPQLGILGPNSPFHLGRHREIIMMAENRRAEAAI